MFSKHIPHATFPKRLKIREQALIKYRRNIINIGIKYSNKSQIDSPPIGLALSGGGIRSAILSLGLIQALAKSNVLHKFDYLSTVSGGGYIGAFLGSWYTHAKDHSEVLNGLSDPTSPQLRYLREHGRYLTPKGEGDILTSIAFTVRNWISVLFVMAVFFLTCFLYIDVCELLLDYTWTAPLPKLQLNWFELPSPGSHFWWSPLLYLSVVPFVGFTLSAWWGYWLIKADNEVIKGLHPLKFIMFNGPIGATWCTFIVSIYILTLKPDCIGFSIHPLASTVWAMIAWVAFMAIILYYYGTFGAYLRDSRVRTPWLIAMGIVTFDILCFNIPTLPHWVFAGIIGLSWLYLIIWVNNVGILVKTPKWHWHCALLAIFSAKEYLYHYSYTQQAQLNIIGVSIVFWLAILVFTIKRPRRIQTDDHARRRLTRYFAYSYWLTIGLVLLGFIDTLGLTIFSIWAIPKNGIAGWIGTLGIGSALAAFTTVQKIITYIIPSKNDRPTITARFVLPFCAFALFSFFLVITSAVAHGIMWKGQSPPGDPGAIIFTKSTPGSMAEKNFPKASFPDPIVPGGGIDLPYALEVIAVTFYISAFLSVCLPFANNSSLSSIYATRLKRTFLRAGSSKLITIPVNYVSNDDDFNYMLFPSTARRSRYQPEAHGGPLHLINVTINQTVDANSNLQALDRKGVGMVIGPIGMSVGVKNHAIRSKGMFNNYEAVGTNDDFPDRAFPKGGIPFTPENMSLSQIIGISGAAVSTGLGSHTTLALSMICGLFNIRLGHWWRSDVLTHKYSKQQFEDIKKMKFNKRIWKMVKWWMEWRRSGGRLGVQCLLLQEWLARFHGATYDRWYLTDGGHYENLACYELIRRRLPFILCCDNDEDPNCSLENLGNLVRKARIDLGAEITFLSRNQLLARYPVTIPSCLGTLEDLRIGKQTDNGNKTAKARAALAQIRYEGDPRICHLLFMKPTIIGTESADILEYQRNNLAFPHEPTMDQFFTESQWESYRQLGMIIGEELCSAKVIHEFI